MDNWQDQIKDMVNRDSDGFKAAVDKMVDTAIYIEKRRNAQDNVNHPQHYKLDGLDIEVIDLIRSATGDKYEGYLLGNLIKYVMRYKKKNGAEDLKKAKVYLDWLIEVSE